MPKAKHHHLGIYFRVAIIVLAIILVVLIFFLVRQAITLRRAQVLSARELWISNVLKQHGPLTPVEVDILRSWMTFDYVNKLFGVPPNYLKDQLSISDARYPQLSIASYAKASGLNANTFLGNVEDALRVYLTAADAAKSATSTVPTSTAHGI